MDEPKKIGRPKGAKDLKPRKPRVDKINFGEEYVQPGDNSKYLRHAMAVRDMLPIDIKDPDAVEYRIDEYFTLCADHEMKPTVTGLCNALGITKETLRSWKAGDTRQGTHQSVILEAYRLLEELWEAYMMNGKINPVSGIFLGKNMFPGYYDKQEFVLTPNQPEITPTDVVEIAAKYEELPTIDD